MVPVPSMASIPVMPSTRMKKAASALSGSDEASTGSSFSSVKATSISTSSMASASRPLLMTIRASNAWRSKVTSCAISMTTRAQRVSTAATGSPKVQSPSSRASDADLSESCTVARFIIFSIIQCSHVRSAQRTLTRMVISVVRCADRSADRKHDQGQEAEPLPRPALHGLHTRMRDVRAGRIDGQLPTRGIDDQVHVLHRHGTEQHLIAQHQGPDVAEPLAEHHLIGPT